MVFMYTRTRVLAILSYPYRQDTLFFFSLFRSFFSHTGTILYDRYILNYLIKIKQLYLTRLDIHLLSTRYLFAYVLFYTKMDFEKFAIF